MGEDNIYVEKRKTDLDNLFKKLTETSSSSPTNNSKSDIPWKIVIPVALLAILVSALVVVMVRKRKQNEIDID